MKKKNRYSRKKQRIGMFTYKFIVAFECFFYFERPQPVKLLFLQLDLVEVLGAVALGGGD